MITLKPGVFTSEGVGVGVGVVRAFMNLMKHQRSES